MKLTLEEQLELAQRAEIQARKDQETIKKLIILRDNAIKHSLEPVKKTGLFAA